MMKLVSIHYYFFRYLCIGIINTFVGYGIIYGLMFLGTDPFLSNAIGYVAGITISYFLNKIYNFKSQKCHKEAFPKFIISLAIAYFINLVILYVSIKIYNINKYIAQIPAITCYTIIGFLGSRYFAFSDADP